MPAQSNFRLKPQLCSSSSVLPVPKYPKLALSSMLVMTRRITAEPSESIHVGTVRRTLHAGRTVL